MNNEDYNRQIKFKPERAEFDEVQENIDAWKDNAKNAPLETIDQILHQEREKLVPNEEKEEMILYWYNQPIGKVQKRYAQSVQDEMQAVFERYGVTPI